MWNPDQTTRIVVELAKLGTVRGIMLDPRALIIWAEALSVYAFDYAMQGIVFLRTEWRESFLTVPLIIEAAAAANREPLGQWWLSDDLTDAYGRALGLPSHPGESWAGYRARLHAATDRQGRQRRIESADPKVVAMIPPRLIR